MQTQSMSFATACPSPYRRRAVGQTRHQLSPRRRPPTREGRLQARPSPVTTALRITSKRDHPDAGADNTRARTNDVPSSSSSSASASASSQSQSPTPSAPSASRKNSAKKRKQSAESRAKISAALKGRRKSASHRESLRKRFGGDGNPMYGRKLSAETRAKISAALTARSRKAKPEDMATTILDDDNNDDNKDDDNAAIADVADVNVDVNSERDEKKNARKDGGGKRRGHGKDDDVIITSIKTRALQSRLIESLQTPGGNGRRRKDNQGRRGETAERELDDVLARVARLDAPPESVAKLIHKTRQMREQSQAPHSGSDEGEGDESDDDESDDDESDDDESDGDVDGDGGGGAKVNNEEPQMQMGDATGITGAGVASDVHGVTAEGAEATGRAMNDSGVGGTVGETASGTNETQVAAAAAMADGARGGGKAKGVEEASAVTEEVAESTEASPETCGVCEGSGFTPCHACVGAFGVVSGRCTSCFGAGAVFCMKCEGVGQLL